MRSNVYPDVLPGYDDLVKPIITSCEKGRSLSLLLNCFSSEEKVLFINMQLFIRHSIPFPCWVRLMSIQRSILLAVLRSRANKLKFPGLTIFGTSPACRYTGSAQFLAKHVSGNPHTTACTLPQTFLAGGSAHSTTDKQNGEKKALGRPGNDQRPFHCSTT